MPLLFLKPDIEDSSFGTDAGMIWWTIGHAGIGLKRIRTVLTRFFLTNS